MSQANKNLFLAYMKAFGSQDIETMTAIMAPDIDVIGMGTSMVSGHRTFDVMIEGSKLMGKVSNGTIRFDVVRMTAEDDRVLGEVEGSAMLITGKPYDNSYVFAADFKHGKMVRLTEYFCTKMADEALSPALIQMGVLSAAD